MDPIKDIYKNWVHEEITDPEVQRAREIFLCENFQTPVASAGFSLSSLISPAFRLAWIGCFALTIMIKTGAFEATQPVLSGKQLTVQKASAVVKNENKAAPLKKSANQKPISKTRASATAKSSLVPANAIQVKKLKSQMGNTAIYQKHFPDVQITVVWVFPKGA